MSGEYASIRAISLNDKIDYSNALHNLDRDTCIQPLPERFAST